MRVLAIVYRPARAEAPNKLGSKPERFTIGMATLGDDGSIGLDPAWVSVPVARSGSLGSLTVAERMAQTMKGARR